MADGRLEGGDRDRRLILQNDVQGVDDTREVTEDGEQDVDEEVGSAATLKEDTQRREEDGKEDLADIAVDTIISPLLVLRWVNRRCR
jgi:hypothetical protein